jgi:tryptophan synthase alpha chain
MSRIAATFNQLRAAGRPALIPFIVAGDPDLVTTGQIVGALIRAGADILELGVPFSDPVADGPVNQRAYQRALAGGVTLRDVLAFVGRTRPTVPVVLLSYYNPIVQYGVEDFCEDAVRNGVDGIVIPDLPADEANELVSAARPAGLDTIFLVAPTSTDPRITLAAARSSGFIYGVSVTGVTGVRDAVSEDVRNLVGRIKRVTQTPVCVGFGLSGPEQARAVAEFADGVIVGSALVSLLEQPGNRVDRLTRFVTDLRRAVDTVSVREGGAT